VSEIYGGYLADTGCTSQPPPLTALAEHLPVGVGLVRPIDSGTCRWNPGELNDRSEAVAAVAAGGCKVGSGHGREVPFSEFVAVKPPLEFRVLEAALGNSVQATRCRRYPDGAVRPEPPQSRPTG
jgi:hypothetical protein